MRVVCPNTGIAPETRAALDASGYEWEPCDVSGSDTAYHALLDRLWSAGEPFAVVEHDIIVTAAALASLEACPRDWCSSIYPYFRGPYAGLGCTRFRGGIMARHPDLMTVVAGMSDETHPPRHWCRLDGWTASVLLGRGERRCTDHPAVGHLDGRPSHGCVPEAE